MPQECSWLAWDLCLKQQASLGCHGPNYLQMLNPEMNRIPGLDVRGHMGFVVRLALNSVHTLILRKLSLFQE